MAEWPTFYGDDPDAYVFDLAEYARGLEAEIERLREAAKPFVNGGIDLSDEEWEQARDNLCAALQERKESTLLKEDE